MSAHQLLRFAGRAPRRHGVAVIADYVEHGRRPLAAMIVCQSEPLAVMTAAILRRGLRNVADDMMYNLYVNYWLNRYGDE